ncbi:MAG: VRR-NUC domain-containing protein [Marinilabiliaceae bacterium]|nr:VRR-NUC domain-containing protein [Marinilabiliaceae bacterium]
MTDKEHQLQVACVRWFKLQYPKSIIYAVPNGGARNVIVAAKLKAEGVLAGVPDLFVAEAQNGFHGLYIEMKVKPNRLSNHQKRIIPILQDKGYYVSVCYTLEEFIDAIRTYFSTAPFS